jgi:hypothetical protein
MLFSQTLLLLEVIDFLPGCPLSAFVNEEAKKNNPKQQSFWIEPY